MCTSGRGGFQIDRRQEHCIYWTLVLWQKTTTLQVVYNELVKRCDYTVLRIDLKNLDEIDLGHLVRVGNAHIFVLIDNAQELRLTG